MRQLTIDPEFRDKVPPMTEAEFRQLEENILKAGRVKSPITVWNDVIVDGHNRWAIIQKHPEIPYEVEEEHFADRYEAIVWICKNQLGRRNLTDAQKTYLIGRQYEAQKMTVGGDRKSKAQNGPLIQGDTAEVIAHEHKIGRNTVKRAAKFSKGVDAAEKIESGAREAILSGKSKVPKSVIAELPEMEPEEQLDVIEAAKGGWAWVPNGEKKKKSAGRSSETRELYRIINEGIANMADDDKPSIGHTPDALVEDLSLIIDDFLSKMRRSIKIHGDVLKTKTDKKRVIATLSEAEAAIKEMKGTIL